MCIDDFCCGGEGGIRTHGRISPTHAFQACSLNHSDTSPCRLSTFLLYQKRHRRACRGKGDPFAFRKIIEGEGKRARSGFGLPTGLKYTGRVVPYSGVVQLVAHGPLEPRILVRVQAPEPSCLVALSRHSPAQARRPPNPQVAACL